MQKSGTTFGSPMAKNLGKWALVCKIVGTQDWIATRTHCLYANRVLPYSDISCGAWRSSDRVGRLVVLHILHDRRRKFEGTDFVVKLPSQNLILPGTDQLFSLASEYAREG